jgi:hypothetical protein
MLHFSAREFDVDAVVAMLQLEPSNVRRQGELSGRGKPLIKSILSIIASEADFNSFKQQVVDVINFIKANRQDLCILRDLSLCLDDADLHFDFGLYTRMFKVAAQVDFLPAELIKLCAEIGAGIMISQYPPSDEDEDDDED